MAALGNGVESARTYGGWFVDESDIPTASYMTRLLGGFTHNEIIEVFTPVYLDTIDVAAELGFFDEPYDIALDPTWVAYSGEKTPSDDGSTLINNPKAGETGIGWCFPVATVMNLDARFTLGVDLTTSSKDTRTDQFRRMLRIVDQEASVGRIHIDREFYSGDAVRMCRAIAGDDWVIRVKRQSDSHSHSLTGLHTPSLHYGKSCFTRPRTGTGRDIEVPQTKSRPSGGRVLIYHVTLSRDECAGASRNI